MSYEDNDAAWDAFAERFAKEIYPEHRVEAIEEFTAERLRSYYVADPRVMAPAVNALQEGKSLRKLGHHAAAVVFFASSIELLLKATLLRPVVHGLVHYDVLAEIIVEHTLGQTGFTRYEKLLASLFFEFAKLDLRSVRRDGSPETLLNECKMVQGWRNDAMHQGKTCAPDQSALGLEIASDTYNLIVHPVIAALQLTVGENGIIQPGPGISLPPTSRIVTIKSKGSRKK